MNFKIKIIKELIVEITNNAIEHYLERIDVNNSSSIEDWKNGYHVVFVDYDGRVMKNHKLYEFMKLYSNFKYDLQNASEEQLDKIIKYLEEEKNYVDIEELDRECYTLDEF